MGWPDAYVDRSRQEAKAAKTSLADLQRLYEGLREKLDLLNGRNHEAQLEIASLTERLTIGSERQAELTQAIHDRQKPQVSAKIRPAGKSARRTNLEAKDAWQSQER